MIWVHTKGAKQRAPFSDSARLLNDLEERVRTRLIENLVAGHDGDEVLRLGQIDDVMGPARHHIHRLNLIARYFEFDDFPRKQVPLLDEAMS